MCLMPTPPCAPSTAAPGLRLPRLAQADADPPLHPAAARDVAKAVSATGARCLSGVELLSLPVRCSARYLTGGRQSAVQRP